MVKDGFSAEKESANCAEMKKLQAGDVSYEENSAAAATRARLEIDGISAEKSQITAKVSELSFLPTRITSNRFVISIGFFFIVKSSFP